MAFRFRLQFFLDHKLRQEDGARRRCAQAAAAVRRQTAAVMALEERFRAEQRQVARRTGQVQEGWLVASGWRHLRRLRAELDRCREDLSALRQEWDRAREALAAAVREREVLEALRERRLFEYRRHLARQEQKQADDIVACRAARKELQPLGARGPAG